MSFGNRTKTRLDLAASGRGLQQTLLLMAYLMTNPRSVLLLDEPDAHLEILRQRQIYQLITEVAGDNDSQIVAASHSEVLLNEAADRDVVVAFVGRPHRIDDRGSQLLKSLKSIGFEHYYQAEITGWVLFLEGSTDLAILREFARLLDHDAQACLERPYVVYVNNRFGAVQEHFYGVQEAKPDLVGFSLFDRMDNDPSARATDELEVHCWKKREIENYFTKRDVLLKWARAAGNEMYGEMFEVAWENTMTACIAKLESAMATLDRSPWSDDLKATDEFLDLLFERFYRELKLPNLLRKTDYHQLARYVAPEDLDPEVSEVLDRIREVASQARPRVS